MRFVSPKPLGLVTALCFASKPLFTWEKAPGTVVAASAQRMGLALMVWERAVMGFKEFHDNVVSRTCAARARPQALICAVIIFTRGILLVHSQTIRGLHFIGM